MNAPFAQESALATRVSELAHEVATLRHEKGSPAARHEAEAMVRAGLLCLQVGLSRLEMRQFMLRELKVVVQRERGPHPRGMSA